MEADSVSFTSKVPKVSFQSYPRPSDPRKQGNSLLRQFSKIRDKKCKLQ